MPYDTYITIRNSSESILHKGSCTPQSGTVAIPPDVDISDDGSTRVVIQGDIAKRKSNGVLSYEAEIAAITTSINFTFTNDESKHTGQATANPSDHINIAIETHFDESTNTLDLTYTIQPVLSRPPRDARSSIKIVNDTDTAVFCMIDSQASDEETKFFAVASALVAAFGFIPFAIPAVATRLAVSAAAKAAAEIAAEKISWATAVLGALTAAPGLASPTSSAARALFPSDTMTHSGGGFIRGSHNIHLLRHKLQGTSLICQYSVLKNYKKPELRILGITKEDTKDVLKLELPRDRYRLAFYRSACIHGLSPKNQTTISMSENIKKQDYAIHFTDRRRREIDFYDLSPPKSTTASFKFEMDVSSDFIITACHNDIATQGSMYNLHYRPTGEVIALFNNWKCDYDTIEQTESAKPKEYGMQKWTNDDIFKQVLDAKNKDIFVFEEYTQYRVPGESTRLRGYKRGQISSLSYKPTTTTPEYRCFFLIPSNMVTLQQAVERVGAQ